MILQFIIEPESLKDVSDRGDWRMFIDSLERLWPSHGVLIMTPDFDESLKQSGLEDHRVSEWKLFIMREAHRKRFVTRGFDGVNWNTLQTWDDLKAYNGHFDLALFQEVRAALFGLLDDDVPCLHDPRSEAQIEIARARHVLFTCQVKEAESMAKRSVTPTQTPDEVWEQRFRKHAIHSTSIAVVDKFAINDWRGLRCFLEKLVTDGWQSDKTMQTVDIYCAYQHFSGQGPGRPRFIRANLQAEATRLSTELGSQLPKVQIKFHLLHPGNLPHDRWIRFDNNIVELGNGLETLDPNRNQVFSFQLKEKDQERHGQERKIKSFCRSQKDGDDIFLSVFSHPPR